jgi:CHASE3 domain sensor protein
MELEEQILKHRSYLNRYYSNTEMLLSQIDVILKLEVEKEQLQHWLRLNRSAVNIVIDILNKKNEKLR